MKTIKYADYIKLWATCDVCVKASLRKVTFYDRRTQNVVATVCI